MTPEQAHNAVARPAYAKDARIGKVGQSLRDRLTGNPAFFVIDTGFLGNKRLIVPTAFTILRTDRIDIDLDAETIKSAPKLDITGDHLTSEQTAQINAHYGLTNSEPAPAAAESSNVDTPASANEDNATTILNTEELQQTETGSTIAVKHTTTTITVEEATAVINVPHQPDTPPSNQALPPA